MELSENSIQEFKDIYKKEFNEDIDDATARTLATQFLNLMRAVYKPSQNNEKF